MSNALIFLPGHFPIGTHVAVVPSHPQHGNATGIVTRHTVKFVTFSPDAFPDSRIRILPKLLLFLPSPTPSSPKHHDRGASRGRVVLWEADDDQARTGRQREQDNDAYDKLSETANIPVADGYVSFTRTFRYLGSLINFSLCDDNDI